MNNYKSTLAEIFHGFPHLDFNFQNTTEIFTPDNVAYQQALMFNGIYLLFVTFCLFFIFAFYFMVASCYFYGNCSSQVLKPRPARSRCLRILIGLFGILSSAALGFAFYGNNKARDGIDNASTSAMNIYNTFDFFKFQNNDVVSVSLKKAEKEVVNLINKIPFVVVNQTENVINSINSNLYNATHLLTTSGNLLKDVGVDLQYYAEKTTSYDDLRWGIFTVFLCFHLLLILVILYATYTNRKCALVGLTLLAVFSLLLMMVTVSVSVPLSIGASDICCNPRQAYLQYIHSAPAKVIVNYYLDCTDLYKNNELFKAYNETTIDLKETLILVTTLHKIPFVRSLPEVENLSRFIKEASNGLEDLKKKITCDAIHQDFQNFLRATCTTTLEGFGLLMLGALIVTVFLICIMLFITPLWKAIAPLRPILKKYPGVHIVTESYQGPPGYGSVARSESFHGSSSFDASYKSIEDLEDFEHVPLVRKRTQPQSYRAVHGSTEFLSVEEDRRSSKGL